MGVWKQVGQSLGGLAKHAAQKIVSEPMEIARDAVGEGLEKGQQTQANTTDPSQGKAAGDLASSGFATQDDFAKYQQLSGNKDKMELAMLRRNLVSQWGLETGVEQGMERARQEYAQKEEQRKQVEEHQEEQKKQLVLEQKKQDDEASAVKAARGAASAENKAWGAG